MPKEAEDLRTMADLLREGVTLTDLSCPACSSPLFKFRSGELWCAQCKKRVIVVKEGEPIPEATSPTVLAGLESTILTKIGDVNKKIEEENDPDQLQKLNVVLAALLENLEKIRKLKGR